jgi:hypothetical protein
MHEHSLLHINLYFLLGWGRGLNNLNNFVKQFSNNNATIYVILLYNNQET